MRSTTTATGSRPVPTHSVSTATNVNASAMAVAIVAIIWQIAAGVDYPTVPPGPIILASVTVVLLVRARWARIVGIVVPLFLLAGVIASIADEENALRHPGDASPFVATVLQLAAVVVGLVAGRLGQDRERTLLEIGDPPLAPGRCRDRHSWFGIGLGPRHPRFFPPRRSPPCFGVVVGTSREGRVAGVG